MANAVIIHPPAHVAHIARILAYKDFPTRRDILAICSTESDFKADAINLEGGKQAPSRGIMQVSGGSLVLWRNMAEGVALLRLNYKMTHSREAAIKAYNIGLGAYRKGKAKISAQRYWERFSDRYRRIQ